MRPLPIRFGPQTCGALDAAASREWLVTDGCGGYAMGTVAGLRTRRYHGLLVVADPTPASRRLGLAALDAVVELPGGDRVRLGVHEWADGVVAPRGHELLSSFDLDDGVPRWRWRVGDVVIERELAMQYGRPSVGVVHRLVAGGPVRLVLEALTTWREVHGERGGWGPEPDVRETSGGAVVESAYRLTGPGWEAAGEWWHGVRMRAEADRGLSDGEDLWLAGRFNAALDAAGDAAEVSAWAGDLESTPPPPTRLVAASRERAALLVGRAGTTDEVDARLVLAADQFVTTAPDVVAGYPWFGAWSRDTMTSYEGLLLETGRADEGRRLLESYAATVSEGMLANTADTGQTEYNTADGTLWFVHAVDRHVTRTGDTDLAALLLPTLEDLVKAHVAGTRYGIRVTDDGLLTQGEAGFALTWMDARVGGVGVTPRIGKPVELNALWLQSLAAVRRLLLALGRHADDVAGLLDRGRMSFARRFRLTTGSLADVVDGPDGDDTSLRPNQLLAVGLPDAVIADPAVIRAVAPLLTPLGLRSLAPSDHRYRPHHRGGPAERDAAYHQGTVWPWLIGPYVDASLATGLRPYGVLDGLEAHLLDWGLGSVSETADGAPPHSATGCPFQAWSVAETLRARRRLAQTAERI
jgi:predicted glycogen debranching enzyme